MYYHLSWLWGGAILVLQEYNLVQFWLLDVEFGLVPFLFALSDVVVKVFLQVAPTRLRSDGVAQYKVLSSNHLRYLGHTMDMIYDTLCQSIQIIPHPPLINVTPAVPKSTSNWVIKWSNQVSHYFIQTGGKLHLNQDVTTLSCLISEIQDTSTRLEGALANYLMLQKCHCPQEGPPMGATISLVRSPVVGGRP